MLFVNTAASGFTPQYMELQELHEKHGDELVIIGFPANNFEVKSQVRMIKLKRLSKNYGVSFMLSEKLALRVKILIQYLNG